MRYVSEDIDSEMHVEEKNEPCARFEVDGDSYVIRFNQKRIDLYENSNRPIMASFMMNGGGLSIRELKALVAYGLCLEGGSFVNPRRGNDMAQSLLEANGYSALMEAVIDALRRDCGFLFKGAM